MASSLDEDEATRIASLLRTIADPVRLRLLSVVATAPEGESCVCDLADAANRSQPTVSHHLRQLVEAGLLDRTQRGRWAWYSLRPGGLDEVRQLLETPALSR